MERLRAEMDAIKVYIIGGTQDDLRKLEAFCQDQGWKFQGASAWGRKSGQWPVLFILDAYKRHKTVRGAARVAEVSPGTAHRILKQAGKL